MGTNAHYPPLEASYSYATLKCPPLASSPSMMLLKSYAGLDLKYVDTWLQGKASNDVVHASTWSS